MANTSNMETLNQIAISDTILLDSELVSKIIAHQVEKAILAQIKLLKDSGVKYELLPKVSGTTKSGIFLLQGKLAKLTFHVNKNLT